MNDSKTAANATVSDDEVRQRAYLLWEADGRPEGNGEQYWHQARHEAMEAMVHRMTDAVAETTDGHNPNEGSPRDEKPAKSRSKAAALATGDSASEAVKVTKPGGSKPKIAKVKDGETKPAKKGATKPRSALQTGN